MLRDKIIAAYSSIPQESIDRLKKVVPQNFNAVLLANDLNATASAYGMSIRSVKISTASASPRDLGPRQSNANPYNTVTITFSVKGRYEQFKEFLKNLETQLHLVDVTRITAVSVDKGSSAGTKGSVSSGQVFQYDVELHTYSLN